MANLTAYEYDVFISYNRNDESWAKRLATRLEQEHWQGKQLRVFFAPWDIKPGQSILGRLEEALPQSRKVCLVMSPNSGESDWVRVERYITHHIDITERQTRLIPLYYRACEIPPFLRHINRIDFQNEAEFEDSYGILLSTIKDEPLPRGEQGSAPTLTLPTEIPRPPVVGFVPRGSRDGRNLIELLRDELAPQKGQLVALWGAGGVGKTTLAAEAARTLLDDFSNRIAWVSADSRTDLPFSIFLDEVATQLGDEDLRKLAPESKSEAVRALVIAQPTLIVLDNFETISTGERRQCLEFLEHAHCSALITTRQRLEHARSVPITGMSPDEARNFLQVLIEQTQDPEIFAASYRERLIKTAESNPLIMEWIVGQIDLANDPEEVLNDLTHGEGDAAHRVFDRSYNLPQLDDGGRAVLLALALFTPSGGRPTLAAVAGMDIGKVRDKKRFKKAQETLASLWLIKKMDGGLRLAVAGLTRELTKAHLASDLRAKTFPQRFVSRFLRYADAHAQPTPGDYDALELEKDNLLNAAEIALEKRDWKSALRLAYVLAIPVNGFLNVRGYWDVALRISNSALRVTRSLNMEEDISDWSHNVAVIYASRGELREARRLYDQALKISKKLDDQKGIASTLHQLAGLAQAQGEVREARQLYERKLGNLNEAW